MMSPAPRYRGYRFPPEIISHAVWLYHRFGLSVRDVEDLLAERGITVSYDGCSTTSTSTSRNGRRFGRWPRRSAARPRRCAIGCARPSVTVDAGQA